MDRSELIAKLKLEVGPFTAFVAGNPLKYTLALFALGVAAGAIIF
jgi:hypothetical protein